MLRRRPTVAVASISPADHAQEHSIAAATTSSSLSSSAEMSNDRAGESRSAVTVDGRSNSPRIAPSHSNPKVLTSSRTARR
jgi:hypothetical protein